MCYVWRIRAAYMLVWGYNEWIWVKHHRLKPVLTEVQRIACGFTAGMASFCFALLILLYTLICCLVSCLITPTLTFHITLNKTENFKNQTNCFISCPTFVCAHVVLDPASSVWTSVLLPLCGFSLLALAASSLRQVESVKLKNVHRQRVKKWHSIHISC